MKYLVLISFSAITIIYFLNLKQSVAGKVFVIYDIASLKFNEDGSFQKNGGSSIIGFTKTEGIYQIKEDTIFLSDTLSEYTMTPPPCFELDTTGSIPIFTLQEPPKLELYQDTLYIWEISHNLFSSELALDSKPQPPNGELDNSIDFHWRDPEIVKLQNMRLTQKSIWNH